MNGQVVEVILRAVDQASGAIRQVEAATENLRQATQRTGAAMDALLGALQAVGGAMLTRSLQNMAQEAFQAEASLRVLANTAQAMGVDYGHLRASLDAVLEPLGVLPQQAASAAAQLLRAGFTTEQIVAAFQAGAASALAAGRTAAQGIENVAMALSTGQSVYLNYIGIAENIGPVMARVASSMKGASEEAVRQAQNQAALNVILKATEQEVASLPTLVSGYAGAQNQLARATAVLRQEIGEALIPVFTALAQVATLVANAIASLSEEQKRGIAIAGLATGALTALLGVAVTLRTAMAGLVPVLRLVGSALRTAILSPVGLVVGAVLALGYAWVQAGDTAEESRKRLALIGQALRGVAELAVGAVQAIMGLFRNLGQSLGGLVSALVQAFRGDLAGAWQTLQRTINLENWAKGFDAANKNLVAGWQSLSATLKGEVVPASSDVARWLAEVRRILEQFGGAIGQVNLEFPRLWPNLDQTGTKANQTKEKLDKLSESASKLRQELIPLWREGERQADVGRPWENLAQAIRTALTEVNLALREGAITQEEAASRIQRAIAIYEPWIRELRQQGLISPEAAQQAYSALDAMVGRLRELSDATQEVRYAWAELISLWRQGERDLSRMPERSVRWAEDLRNQLTQLQMNLGLGLIDPSQARSALRDLIDAYGKDLAQALRTGAITAQDARAVLDALGEATRYLTGLTEEHQRALTQWLIGEKDLSEAIEESAITLEDYQAAIRAGTAAWREGERALLEYQAALDALAQAEADYAASAYAMKAAESLPNVIRQAGEAIQASVASGAMTAQEAIAALSQAIEAYSSQIEEAFQSGLLSPSAYLEAQRALQGLQDAMGRFRLELLQTVGPLHAVVEDVEEFVPAQDWYDLPAILGAYREELERIGRIPDPAERLKALSTLSADFSVILPYLEQFLNQLEEAGVITDDLRQRMEELQQSIEETAREAEQARLDETLRGWAEAANAVAGAINAIGSALNAPTIGSGLARLASGIGGLVSAFLPGGQLLGGLIGAVGGLIGGLVDAIVDAFDAGWSKANQAIDRVAERFSLVGREAFANALQRVNRGGILGFLFGGRWEVNQELLQLIASVASALESGVLQGVRRAAKAFLEGAANWAEVLRQGIREAIANAVIEAVVQGAIVKGALGKLLTDLTSAIATGDMGLARQIAGQIMAAVPALERAIAGVLAPFQGFLGGGTATGGITLGGPTLTPYSLPMVSVAGAAHITEFGTYVDQFGGYVAMLVQEGIEVRAVVEQRPSEWR